MPIKRIAWMLLLATVQAACSTAGRPPATADKAAGAAPTAAAVAPAGAVAPAAAAPVPATAAATAPAAAPPAPGKGRHDCVVIDAANEQAGLAAEGKWLHEHYPGWKKVGQALVVGADGKSRFDDVDILDAAGEKHTVCFDITSFFGKW